MSKTVTSQSGEASRPVNIVFVGAGAVGCFYASRLHHPQQNIHTSLIARSNYKAIAAGGVKLQTHTFGDYTFVPASVFPSVAAAVASTTPGSSEVLDRQPSAPRTEWDYVVVTTKALPDRTDDSELVAPLISSGTAIVLVQNGVGVEEQYRRRFPDTPIVSAVTVISAEQISPGVVRQNRWTRIHMGPYTNSASFDTGSRKERGGGDLHGRGTEKTRQLADIFTRLGGVRDAEVTNEIGLQTIRWHKLCINAAMNPSAVLCGGLGNADMVLDPELRAHLAGVMKEIWDAAPLILGREDPFRGLADAEKILKSTERNVGSKPSMLLDWEAGRPLEIEVILGNPVRIARVRGVDLPRMQSLYALLRSAQRLREGKKGEVKGRL
ncbi:2-dehydropantoate 2-reductase [Coniochaeta ligniaria NRRL 30616]|uniref:2-dehydropantoate 2-reductase n=1 Tax=Coniochaeta ligniaria NRRL 30616 TaxID=1408157 RepID=A0A1J7IBK2_9PEZI|nr:2-dehydropantoate 2-reductase [Coniochaeta ligniaria NRRL 30616]